MEIVPSPLSAVVIIGHWVSLTVPREVIQATLEQFNYAFAPNFHPAFKEVMPVRRAADAGKRTVFNLLGPMINPGNWFSIDGRFRSRLPVLAASMGAMGLQLVGSYMDSLSPGVF